MASKPATLWIVAAVLYAALSAVCFLSSSIPFLSSLVEGHWGLVWALGPPAALLYGSDYLATYLIGSAIVIACVAGITRGFRRASALLLVSAVLGLCSWVAFGLVAYAPTM